MKKIVLLFVLVTVFAGAKAQITLEHEYDSASTGGNSYNNLGTNQLMIVNFENSGEKYVKINRSGQRISIYNLNHSLWKTISLANCPLPAPPATGLGDILYLSENLFNLDNNIEFMYIMNPYSRTNIYNEYGALIFTDTGAAWVKPNWHMQQYPIYNTSQGTKMILSYPHGCAKVFSLPGTLSMDIAKSNEELIGRQGSVSNAYPNPAENYTRIDYNIPDDVNEAEIVFYNLEGVEVKRFNVDHTFGTIMISTADIEAGSYFYQMQTHSGYSDGKKLIVIK